MQIEPSSRTFMASIGTSDHRLFVSPSVEVQFVLRQPSLFSHSLLTRDPMNMTLAPIQPSGSLYSVPPVVHLRWWPQSTFLLHLSCVWRATHREYPDLSSKTSSLLISSPSRESWLSPTRLGVDGALMEVSACGQCPSPSLRRWPRTSRWVCLVPSVLSFEASADTVRQEKSHFNNLFHFTASLGCKETNFSPTHF